jgi:hypothetical protein
LHFNTSPVLFSVANKLIIIENVYNDARGGVGSEGGGVILSTPNFHIHSMTIIIQ